MPPRLPPKHFKVNGKLELIICKDHFSTSNVPRPNLKEFETYVWAVGFVVEETDDAVMVLTGGCYDMNESPDRSTQMDTVCFRKADIEYRRKL